MRKVCHMTSAHDAEDVRIFHKECVSLAEGGYEVYLVERGESYEKNGVLIVGVGEIPEGRLKRMTEGARRVFEAALALDCELYHLHDPELLPYALKLKRMGKKVIFDSHENTAASFRQKEYLPAWLRSSLGGLYASYERQVCRALDAVVTVTPTQTDYFSKINPHAWEIRNYPIVSESYEPPLFEKKAIGFAGGISEDWNHERIIRALERLPQCRYVLCGRDNGFRRSLERLPAWDRVDYLGQIPHAQVATALRGCMVGMALLDYCENTAGKTGTLGNTKIFEEMMAGLPVVCTDFVLWREFVERYHCGICVDPGDDKAVEDAIRRLIGDPALAREMGENGRKAVLEEFNWKTQALKLAALYRQLTE